MAFDILTPMTASGVSLSTAVIAASAALLVAVLTHVLTKRREVRAERERREVADRAERERGELTDRAERERSQMADRAERERSQMADRAEHERDRLAREGRYLGFHEAVEAMDAHIVAGEGVEALSELRRAGARATFRAGGGVTAKIGEAVTAAERWVRVAATNSPSHAFAVEARQKFVARCAELKEAIEADLGSP